MRVCIIEGVIGSGKSTILTLLAEGLKPYFPNIVIVPEPVDIWRSTGALEAFYNDVHGKAYEFQTFAFCTRVQAVLSAFEANPNADLYLIERSPYADRHMFVKVLQEQGHFSDLQTIFYEKWWDVWMKLWPFAPTHVININPNLPICMERIQMRARPGEDTVSLEYQTELLKKHEDYFTHICKYPVLELDNHANITDNKVKENIIRQVLKFLS